MPTGNLNVVFHQLKISMTIKESTPMSAKLAEVSISSARGIMKLWIFRPMAGVKAYRFWGSYRMVGSSVFFSLWVGALP